MRETGVEPARVAPLDPKSEGCSPQSEKMEEVVSDGRYVPPQVAPLSWVDAENVLGNLLEVWQTLPEWVIQAIARLAELNVGGSQLPPCEDN